ncbi:MAG TPA: transglutaminase-like domain-containing protein [Gammaproteobacteria bacterium]|nr:transglutaminase-like domain-containing protein [Gammaproteobacteria bacterium]
MHQGNTQHSGALIGAMRESGWTMRSIASIVILTFGGLVTSPAVAAVTQEVQKIQWHKAEEGHGAKLSEHLLTIRDHLKIATASNLKASSFSDARKQFKEDATALADLDKQSLADFASTRAMIKDKHLPDVILQRETAAETHYKTEMAALRQGLDSVVNEKDDAKAQADSKYVLDRLSKFQMERSQQKFDPKNLPNRSLKPDLTRKPFTTKKQFAEAGFIGNPRLMVATSAPNFDYSQLPGANNPAYLAATTEVTLSPAIQAQAAALNYNPVQIYNWVRNNIQWQPTWGAVQDADLTLSSRQGNAFDISSLLIALLRASNIPARYVLGTIDVPADKFRNWVGGFQDINAAVNYASAGGIPITTLYAGGQITTIQMQHIWVEAAIDYIPSHGAINKSADTWVPMDASYKQYTIQTGLDPVAISGIDPNAVAQQFVSSGTVDTINNYATGFNSSIFQNALQTAQTNIQNYITQNLPNATIGQIFGGNVVIQATPKALSASLPYVVQVKGATYGNLPSSLEQSITFALGTDALGDPQNPVTFPWPQINNHQVTLSFQPATPTDTQALQSLLPSGQVTDVSQLPTSIPAYLINVTPVLKVDGQVVSSGPALTMGSEITFVFSPNFVGRFSIPNTYSVIAGSYLDIAVVAGSISQQQISNLQTSLQNTQAALQSNDPTQKSTLTNEQVFGDLYQAGVLDYYNQYTVLANLYGRQQGGYLNLAAGIGSLGYEPKVDQAFGIPQDIRDGGIVANIPIINIFGYDNSSQALRANYVRQVGMLSSSLEASVPEQLLGASTLQPVAISAASALYIAGQQGQRIYHITQANQGATLPLIHHSASVMQEISDALAAGKEVITHTDDISEADWSGSGYIILDPNTGDGAYKISGGMNGGAAPFKAFSASSCNPPSWTAIIFGSLFAALSVFTIFAGLYLLISGLALWALAASLIGGLFGALATFGLGYNAVLLAGFRAAASITLSGLAMEAGVDAILSTFAFSMLIFSYWIVPLIFLFVAISLAAAKPPCTNQASRRSPSLSMA